jgi:site-specific DNA recombinase
MTAKRHVPPKSVRCAIYCRKSTVAGLEQDFNSLDAQRESAEAFIRSQAHEGWIAIPEDYSDGGFSGGNLDRPGLKRLTSDIEAGRIDVVLVYKVDRLSRSLLDFARLMSVFDSYNVAFVSVTQQFNTATSMGRLVLNVLLSFAQFERELVSERTKDKIRATRQKGKWCGGHPLLGFDIDPRGFRLVVNEEEAAQIREIFRLYLQHEALLPVVEELNRRGWRTKRWTTRNGKARGGQRFTRTNLYQQLTNPTYIGKVRYKTEVYDGEHQAIVEPDVWQRVQAILKRNHHTGGASVRNSSGALLKGLLWCQSCSCAMTPTSTGGRNRRYRYYACTSAQKQGFGTCPSKSIPAGEIERFVIDHIKCIGNDPALIERTCSAVKILAAEQTAKLETERRDIERSLAKWHSEVQKLAEHGTDAPALAYLADLQDRIRHSERRLSEIDAECTRVRTHNLEDWDIAATLAAFDPVWEQLSPREQCRLVHLLVERVTFDGGQGRVAIRFHPTGITALAEQLKKERRGA